MVSAHNRLQKTKRKKKKLKLFNQNETFYFNASILTIFKVSFTVQPCHYVEKNMIIFLFLPSIFKNYI